MSNDLTWWTNALAGNVAPIDPNTPACGWYRARRKGQAYVPVMFWYDNDGEVQCLYDKEPLTSHVAIERWPYISKNPIAYEVYVAVVERGEEWPDIDPTVAAQLLKVGDNNPPTDPADIIQEQIESASAGAKAYETITDDDTAAKAQTLRSRLLELSGQADGLREKLKKPHWDAGKAVDTKWNPLVRGAKDVADTIRAALGVWETSKLRKQRTAEAALAQAEAEKAKSTGQPVPPPPEAMPPTPPTTIKGAAGRAASVKPRRVVTAIINMEAAFHCFKNNEELKALLMKLAQQTLDKNQDVLGFQIEERMNVK